MFDFPNAPTLNQVFIDPTSGVSYRWDGAAWRGGPIDQGASVPIISDTPPAASIPGQLWFESDTGNLFILYADVNSTQWVQLNYSPVATNYVAKTGDTMNGNLKIDPPSGYAALSLDAPAGTVGSIINGSRNNLARWSVEVGNATAEAGSNTGSDFSIDRYNDAGTYVDVPFLIARNTGIVTANIAMPTAFAHRAGAGSTTLGTSVWTKVNIATLGVNVGGWAVSGNNLIVPKNGVYQIGGSVIISAPATQSALLVGIGINNPAGASFQARVQNPAATGNWCINVQRPVALTAGDALSLLGFATAAGFSVTDGSDGTFMWATMVAAT